MAVLRSPFFIICCLLFIAHQLLQKVFKITWPLADAYLDNLLAMPVILTLLLAEKQWLFKKGSHYRLSIIEIIVTTIYIFLITEFVFPRFSDKFTGDITDGLFYTIGSILFYHTVNKIPASGLNEAK